MQGYAIRGSSHSKHPYHSTPLSLVDAEGSDAVHRPFVVMTAQSTPRSASMEYWDTLWALEAELERDGFRRFRDIGPLYNRDADTADPFIRRATRPTLVTSTPRGGSTQVAAVNIGPRIQRVEPIQDSATRYRLRALLRPADQSHWATHHLQQGRPDKPGRPSQKGHHLQRGRPDKPGRPTQKGRHLQQGRPNKSGRPSQKGHHLQQGRPDKPGRPNCA